MSYGTKYGRNRIERATRMYKERPPDGMVKPEAEIKRFRALRINAHFGYGRYVEDLTRPEIETRDFIVVRSQKTSNTHKKYYFIELLSPEAIKTRARSGYLRYCTCKDRNPNCKHKLAIRFTVRQYIYNLRY